MKSRNTAQLKAYNKEKQLKYAANKPAGAAPSISYCNANTGSIYTGVWMDCNQPGADDHLSIGSVGMGAQISVRAV